MKTLYFRRRSALVESRIFSFGAVLVGVAVLLVAIKVTVPNVFTGLTMPVLRTGTALSAGVAAATGAFANTQTLIQERNALTQQNATLTSENQTLAARVQDLTGLLGTTTPPVQGVAAGVRARPPESPYDSLIINAGSQSGVAVGNYVLAQGGIPIGAIASVTAQEARVLLYSAAQATTTAWVGSARTPIILTGEGGGLFTARVPRQVPVVVGDVVFIAGPGRVHPIGTVERMDANPAATTVTLRIQPFVDIFSLTTVEVVPHTSS